MRRRSAVCFTLVSNRREKNTTITGRHGTKGRHGRVPIKKEIAAQIGIYAH